MGALVVVGLRQRIIQDTSPWLVGPDSAASSINNFLTLQESGFNNAGSSPIELWRLSEEIRKTVLKMIHKAGSGHPGSSLSCIDIIVTLFNAVMRYKPDEPKWPGRDWFILSKGHAAPALYAVLANAGYFPKEDLFTLRQIGSHLQGHPDSNKTPGIEISTGSLGQGLSVANGIALSLKLDKKDNRVYVLLGDGELDEGQVWEAAMTASHYRLDNVCAIVDRNGFQLDGETETIKALEQLADKWISFGWNVIEVDGHNISHLISAFNKAKAAKNQPTVIIARTIKGKGVSFMENNNRFHGQPPTDAELIMAIKEIDERLGLNNTTSGSPAVRGSVSISLINSLVRHFFNPKRAAYQKTILYAEDNDKTAKRVVRRRLVKQLREISSREVLGSNSASPLAPNSHSASPLRQGKTKTNRIPVFSIPEPCLREYIKMRHPNGLFIHISAKSANRRNGLKNYLAAQEAAVLEQKIAEIMQIVKGYYANSPPLNQRFMLPSEGDKVFASPSLNLTLPRNPDIIITSHLGFINSYPYLKYVGLIIYIDVGFMSKIMKIYGRLSSCKIPCFSLPPTASSPVADKPQRDINQILTDTHTQMISNARSYLSRWAKEKQEIIMPEGLHTYVFTNDGCQAHTTWVLDGRMYSAATILECFAIKENMQDGQMLVIDMFKDSLCVVFKAQGERQGEKVTLFGIAALRNINQDPEALRKYLEGLLGGEAIRLIGIIYIKDKIMPYQGEHCRQLFSSLGAVAAQDLIIHPKLTFDVVLTRKGFIVKEGEEYTTYLWEQVKNKTYHLLKIKCTGIKIEPGTGSRQKKRGGRRVSSPLKQEIETGNIAACASPLVDHLHRGGATGWRSASPVEKIDERKQQLLYTLYHKLNTTTRQQPVCLEVMRKEYGLSLASNAQCILNNIPTPQRDTYIVQHLVREYFSNMRLVHRMRDSLEDNGSGSKLHFFLNPEYYHTLYCYSLLEDIFYPEEPFQGQGYPPYSPACIYESQPTDIILKLRQFLSSSWELIRWPLEASNIDYAGMAFIFTPSAQRIEYLIGNNYPDIYYLDNVCFTDEEKFSNIFDISGLQSIAEAQVISGADPEETLGVSREVLIPQGIGIDFVEHIVVRDEIYGHIKEAMHGRKYQHINGRPWQELILTEEMYMEMPAVIERINKTEMILEEITKHVCAASPLARDSNNLITPELRERIEVLISEKTAGKGELLGLSRKLGIPYGNLSNWRKGKGIRHPAYLKKILKYFGLWDELDIQTRQGLEEAVKSKVHLSCRGYYQRGEQTLEDLAREMGISYEMVRYLQNKAYYTIRKLTKGIELNIIRLEENKTGPRISLGILKNFSIREITEDEAEVLSLFFNTSRPYKALIKAIEYRRNNPGEPITRELLLSWKNVGKRSVLALEKFVTLEGHNSSSPLAEGRVNAAAFKEKIKMALLSREGIGAGLAIWMERALFDHRSKKIILPRWVNMGIINAADISEIKEKRFDTFDAESVADKLAEYNRFWQEAGLSAGEVIYVLKKGFERKSVAIRNKLQAYMLSQLLGYKIPEKIAGRIIQTVLSNREVENRHYNYLQNCLITEEELSHFRNGLFREVDLKNFSMRIKKEINRFKKAGFSPSQQGTSLYFGFTLKALEKLKEMFNATKREILIAIEWTNPILYLKRAAKYKAASESRQDTLIGSLAYALTPVLKDRGKAKDIARSTLSVLIPAGSKHKGKASAPEEIFAGWLDNAEP